ncbi:LuxR family transcriptional regulator [Streptomyces sp. 150FB]|uniref:LuxR C-terminal-related transcriptional regulator n=1 Tax=Streptomyces sp. 150FB TaxID=1576605 RepID=UPI000589087C|nr:LuxR C-terminal-related transcriptional regulator [Streptomyces sp. 150FB]KIF76481.1 LuxR family transcriptional regulator [Streptomyces sp. 150FB]
MKDVHPGAWTCECPEASRGKPCATALATYRRALLDGRVPRGEVPDCLHALRLFVDDTDSAGFMSPVPPATASTAALGLVEEEIAEQNRTLRSLQSAFTEFQELYAEASLPDQPVITRLAGRAVVNAAIDAEVTNCREEILTMQSGSARPPHLLAEALPRSLALLARGVRQRTVYQHAVLSDPATLSHIEQLTPAGAEVRTIAEVTDRVLIFDREVAFLPVDDTGPPVVALRVQHPALVRFLVNHFDSAWTRSVPVRPEATRHTRVITSDLQRTILLAVVNGETDDSIARRIGMSRRSVAEHMRKVSEQLGSTSRAQLGYLLATSGLLGDP